MAAHDIKLAFDRTRFPHRLQRLNIPPHGGQAPDHGTGIEGDGGETFNPFDQGKPDDNHRDFRRSHVWISWAALLVMVVTFWVFALIGVAHTLGFTG